LRTAISVQQREDIVLPVVLYGYENWSLILREEHGVRVFENRRIFGPKRDEVTGGWSKIVHWPV
jgi:hypothetical protein